MDLSTAAILWVTLFFMLLGLLTLVIPVLPGLVIMWLAALAYGIVHGFGSLGIILMVIITILAVAGSLVDNLFMGVGARSGGASWSTILVALLAGLVGTVAFPPFGGFIAAPLAVLLIEYFRLRDLGKAWAALRGLATGFGAAIVVRFLIGLMILSLWAFWVWRG
ncbi:MAG: hypothetical protein B6D39_06485 [Anaerolineae bacterium UTCFX2]|jgi:uncharacterized protein YqgC (DUF456 family)|nr:DUF456 domain-containing protein [Anaerolineae bacterium]MCZ7552505.1 DUF456 domain-containing protein [Anaerolineales bacterium]OQY91595.1 MAG: hypothetical protein B6D39_06485 [Anaerolineae bacterium UTCFX2]